MDFATGIQENLIAILCFDEVHAPIVRNLVPSKYWNKYYRELFESAAEFLDKYDKPIDEHLLDEVERLGELRPKDAEAYLRLYQSIAELGSDCNVEYVLQRASQFMEYQTIKAALFKAAEVLEKGTPEAVMEARTLLSDATKVSFENFDPGLELSDVGRFGKFLDGDNLECFPTGIPELDQHKLGPTRKRLHVLGAVYGKGKSWWMLNMAKHCLSARAKMLYIPLEMGEEEQCERIAMNFFGMGKTEEEHEFFLIEKGDGGQVLDIHRETMNAPNLAKSEDQAVLLSKAEIFKRRPRFIIKAWPSGHLTINLLKAYLDNLEASMGFVPDIIFIDYLGIMKITSPKDKRLELGQLAVDFRGLCQERNIAGVTVAQLNRAGMSVQVATGEQIGEDFSIPQHADFFFTYNQTPDEELLGTARIWVEKGRPTKSKFGVLITQDYGRGQFCVDSARMDSGYWDLVKELKGEDDGNHS